MEQVIAYKTSDGALFQSVGECEEHETSLLWRTKISDFLKSDLNPYPAGAHVNMARKVIVAWERFKTGRPAGSAGSAAGDTGE